MERLGATAGQLLPSPMPADHHARSLCALIPCMDFINLPEIITHFIIHLSEIPKTPSRHEVELHDRTLPILAPRSELTGSVPGRYFPSDGLVISFNFV